jgi:hypothetical protein
MDKRNFCSAIKFTSNRKGAKPYYAYVTPEGLVRWKELPEFIEVRGRCYQRHIMVDRKIGWIELKAKERDEVASNYHYCLVCGAPTNTVDFTPTNLFEDIDNNIIQWDSNKVPNMDDKAQTYTCHCCPVCSTETFKLDSPPIPFVLGRRMNKIYCVMLVRSENRIHRMYQDSEGRIFIE